MGTIGNSVDATIGKLEDQLTLWKAKLNELAAKTQAAGHEAKVNASKKELEDLRLKIATAQAKLDESKAAGGDKWESFKDGIASSWSELEEAFKGLTR